MRSETHLKNIIESVEGINIGLFFACAETCISGFRKRTAFAENENAEKRNEEESDYEILDAETDRIISLIAVVQASILGLPAENNGKNGKTGFYVRSLKKQQTELLIALGDEIEIIRSTIKRFDHIRKLIEANSLPLRKANELLAIIRDRIKNRPSFILIDASEDEKLPFRINGLNRTFQTIRDYETDMRAKFEDETDRNILTSFSNTLNTPLNESRHDIGLRKKRIITLIAEFQKGFRMLIWLSEKGYSWRIKRQLEKIVERHNRRITEFRETILAMRSASFDQLGSSA